MNCFLRKKSYQTEQMAAARKGGEYNVCFQGVSLNVGNRGCRALAVSLIKLVIDRNPKARIYLLYGNRTSGIQSLKVSGRTVKVNIVNFRLSPRARVSEHLFWILFLACVQRIIPIRSIRNKLVRSNQWLKTLEDAHFIGEIRGGDSFSDIYGLRRFLLGIIPSIIVILMRKKLFLLPQTYGPFKSRIARIIAHFILLRSDQILARATESITLVRDLLGPRGKHKVPRLCPDVAFVLESALPEKPDIQPKLDRNSSVPLIGLNISGLLYVGGFTHNNMFGLRVNYKEFVHVMLEWLMARTNAHVLLVPHVYGGNWERDEWLLCCRLLKSMDEQYADRLHTVVQEYDQSELKGIIGLCDFFIGSRMHACISALSQGIPTVGLAYSKKFRGVFECVGAGQFAIDMRQSGAEEILAAISAAFDKRTDIAERLKIVIPCVQERILSALGDML